MATSTPLLLPVFFFVGLFLLLPVNLADACGYVLYLDRGVITSPSYPHHYPAHSFCQWNIKAPKRAVFTLNFTHFYLESGCQDKVQVYGMVPSEGEWTNLGEFCGFALPPTITFEGTKMRIYFSSDGSNQFIGFFSEYFYVVDATTTIPPSIATSSPKEISNEEVGISKETTLPIATSLTKGILNDEVGLAIQKLFDWFMGLRRRDDQTRKWDHQLPRIAVALFLADQEKFKTGNTTIYEMNTELTIRLFSKILGGGHLERRDLSLFIPALMVTCVDPRNFHGRDLVAELRSDIESNNGTVSAFELLVLCNAGDAMSNKDVQRIASIFDSQHRPFWTDNQAMATMALACVSAQPGGIVDEITLLDMAQELKKQFRKGAFDNIKTTALVVQALVATGSVERDFDLGSAIRSLIAAQREDGSVGSFMDSYYVLPALANATLLDVTTQHCKRPNISETEALSELRGSHDSRVSITYSVAFGTDMDFKRTLTLKVLVNSSLYNVLETVHKLDSRQNLKYNLIEGKPYISSVMGIEDDVETSFYWFTYLRKHSSEDSILVEDSPVDVKIATNQELILWYKSGQWK